MSEVVKNASTVERWGIFEIELNSKKEFDNPFTDICLSAEFTGNGEDKKVNGFYDGDGTWKIRFMPGMIGEYNYKICSSVDEFDGQLGTFESTWPSEGNKGPVSVAKKHHFNYADGSPMYVNGTTIYAWWYRPEETCKETLSALQENKFNKARMLIFPKYLAGMAEIDLTHEPPCLPFEGSKNNLDYMRPTVEYFKLLDERVEDLMKIGVECDIILFHNYDFGMWGVDENLSDADEMFYLDYVIARLGSYRNIWWSLANEYDLWKDPDGGQIRCKLDRRDWDRIGEYLLANDPYNHLRSIHNWQPVYPNRDWLTHVSYQFPNTYSLTIDLKNKYDKPIVNDEYQYEGSLTYGWGNLTGKQELLRHTLTVMAGGYATHGECYVVNGNKRDIFWTYGGKMVGESASRIAYLRDIMEKLPFQDMAPDLTKGEGLTKFCFRKTDEVLVYLYTEDCEKKDKGLGAYSIDGILREYDVTVHDLWDMKVTRQFEMNSNDINEITENSIIMAVFIKKG